MKHKLTAEQTAARDARRDKFRAIVKSVAAMTDAQRADLAGKIGGVLTCEGRTLSLKNCLILALQAPDCTIVGGFRQELRKLRQTAGESFTHEQIQRN